MAIASEHHQTKARKMCISVFREIVHSEKKPFYRPWAFSLHEKWCAALRKPGIIMLERIC